MTKIRQAGRILEALLAEVGPIEMGFRIQGLAAHVLLGLGCRVTAVRSSGHPDIVAVDEKGAIRVEVEADMTGMGTHLPQPDALTALRPQLPNERGYFAVAICTLLPRWVVVESWRLTNRSNKLVLPLLESLSDKSQSSAWSEVFEQLVLENERHLADYSFEWLAEQALAQRCLVRKPRVSLG